MPSQWTLTEGEEGYLLSRLTGHMSEPWGVIVDQRKAIALLEILEFGDVLKEHGLYRVPKKPARKKRPKRG